MPRPTVSRLLTGLALAVTLVAFPLGALASHQFGDVPDSNPFHADIDALADSGVTTGCGGGNFCPSANVTREQMAAFMNRLGALAPGKTPVVNADKVDGIDGNALLLGTGTIPSGVTVTGAGVWDYVSVSDNQDVELLVELPARAPVNLTADTVNFAPNTIAIDDDAACTGTDSAPTAPAGKVCIYVAGSFRTDGAQGYNSLLAGFEDRYFRIIFATNDATPSQDMYLQYTWAYTAP